MKSAHLSPPDQLPSQRFYQISKVLMGFSIAILASNYGIAPAVAEGSKELVANGGNRPYTEWRTNTTAGILRRTVLKVYAKKDEIINLGSSAVGVGSGNIKLFSSTANVDSSTPLLDCQIKQPIAGILNTVAKESAGPVSTANVNGYIPCTYTAASTGIYQVIFYGPDGVTGMTDPSTNGSDLTNPVIDTNQRSTVAMWDITVRSSLTSTTNLTGRVFTDYVALIMGANSRYLKSKFYILTNDGYQYLTDLGIGQGIDPNGFIFFANKTGLLNSSSQTLYHSGTSTANNIPVPLNGGVLVPSPNNPPIYPTFFNLPSSDAIGGLGYPSDATPPIAATNFLFVGGTGGIANQTPEGVGGTFNFNALQAGSYQIVIDTNTDGIYDPAGGDRVLEGTAVSGTNSIIWDGKDNLGNVLLPRADNLAYNARIILRGGEYHFPLIDVETAANGFQIKMLNPPSGGFSNGANATTIYFDDRNYTTNSTAVNLGCTPTTPITPTSIVCDARTGIDSVAGAHRFGTNYGDQKVIDTWTYFPGAPLLTPIIVFKTKISGKVWNDLDNSANNTFSNINTGSEVGTNAGGLNAILVGSNNKVLSTAAVAADGTYVFTNAPSSQNGLTIRLSTTTVVNSSPAPSAILPANWVQTSPLTTAAFNIVTTSIVGKDFGIKQLLPNVLLVKRITALNGQPTKIDGTSLNIYENEIGYPYDDNDNTPPTTTYPHNATDKWPRTLGHTSSTFLLGAINGVNVKPKDELEYTIYFLSAGAADAQSVSLCDLIPENQTFVPNAYNYLYTGSGSATRGIALAIGNNPVAALTNTNDVDQGRYYPAPEALPDACKILGTIPTNTNGAVVVNLGTLPKPSSTAADANGYGYIRFRTKVN